MPRRADVERVVREGGRCRDSFAQGRIRSHQLGSSRSRLQDCEQTIYCSLARIELRREHFGIRFRKSHLGFVQGDFVEGHLRRVWRKRGARGTRGSREYETRSGVSARRATNESMLNQ